MKTKKIVRTYSVWFPITDLSQWYTDSKNRGLGYQFDILNCLGETIDGILDTAEARKKSPLFSVVRLNRPGPSNLTIYVGGREGIFGGHKGTVPIYHSINFSNKIVSESAINEAQTWMVSDYEKTLLYEGKPQALIMGKLVSVLFC